MRLGLFTSRFWSVRICGGFVRHCGWVALGVGFRRSAFAVVSCDLVVGRVRRWFRSARVAVVSFVSMFLRVWCWFGLRVWCLFGVGPSRCVRWFRFSALLCWLWSFALVFCRSVRAVVSYRFPFVQFRMLLGQGRNWKICVVN